jgi:hypothetical protein
MVVDPRTGGENGFDRYTLLSGLALPYHKLALWCPAFLCSQVFI